MRGADPAFDGGLRSQAAVGVGRGSGNRRRIEPDAFQNCRPPQISHEHLYKNREGVKRHLPPHELARRQADRQRARRPLRRHRDQAEGAGSQRYLSGFSARRRDRPGAEGIFPGRKFRDQLQRPQGTQRRAGVSVRTRFRRPAAAERALRMRQNRCAVIPAPPARSSRVASGGRSWPSGCSLHAGDGRRPTLPPGARGPFPGRPARRPGPAGPTVNRFP